MNCRSYLDGGGICLRKENLWEACYGVGRDECWSLWKIKQRQAFKKECEEVANAVLRHININNKNRRRLDTILIWCKEHYALFTFLQYSHYPEDSKQQNDNFKPRKWAHWGRDLEWRGEIFFSKEKVRSLSCHQFMNINKMKKNNKKKKLFFFPSKQ